VTPCLLVDNLQHLGGVNPPLSSGQKSKIRVGRRDSHAGKENLYIYVNKLLRDWNN
jgi:hypothetical protein